MTCCLAGGYPDRVTPSNGRHRRAWRAIALLLIVTGWGVPLAFPHAAQNDLLCAPAAAGERGEASRLVQGDQTAQAEHCEVCHSLRSFRHAGLPSGITSADLSSARRLVSETSAPADRFTTRQLPARAPPARA